MQRKWGRVGRIVFARAEKKQYERFFFGNGRKTNTTAKFTLCAVGP